MDNFRRRNRDNNPRRSIDSILNAPLRPQSPGHSYEKSAGRFGGFRSTSGRKVDDFRRSEGFHTSQSTGVRASATPIATEARPVKTDKRGASLLHMTLPGGVGIGDARKKSEGRADGKPKRSKWGAFRKWTLRSALVLTALVLLIGGFLLFKGIIKLHKVFKGGGAAAALQAEVTPDLLKGEGDGRVNILLLGKGGIGHAGGELTDTMIVASVDPVNKRTVLVSVPRDLWVTTPGHGSSKINAVYAFAKDRSLATNPKDKEKAEKVGITAVEQVVSQVLGIPIHYYGMIDFRGFKKAVDIVGGVDIKVPPELAVKEHLWDSTTGKNYYLNVPAGKQHFDSTRALYFTRSRHTSLRGDFSRSERQRLFLQALSQKVLSAGTYTNPLKISQLMSAFGDHLSTDLSISNALRLMDIGKGMSSSPLKSIGLADPPNSFVRTDSVGSQSVVRPTAGFGDYSAIQNYIRNTLKDPYLAKENARIAVLNGTTVSGLATKKANELKSYGYNVTVIDDAPTHDYMNTVIVDVSKGKKPFTRNYLEKRLEQKAVATVPDSKIDVANVDFVVILGQND